MSEAIHRARAQPDEAFVLVFLSDPAPGLYERTKRLGDILMGVPTQCVVRSFPIDANLTDSLSSAGLGNWKEMRQIEGAVNIIIT